MSQEIVVLRRINILNPKRSIDIVVMGGPLLLHRNFPFPFIKALYLFISTISIKFFDLYMVIKFIFDNFSFSILLYFSLFFPLVSYRLLNQHKLLKLDEIQPPVKEILVGFQVYRRKWQLYFLVLSGIQKHTVGPKKLINTLRGLILEAYLPQIAWLFTKIGSN